jgi:hypothetical protein
MAAYDHLGSNFPRQETGPALHPVFDQTDERLDNARDNHWCLGAENVGSFDDRRPSAPVQLLVWMSMDPDLRYPGLGNVDNILQLLAGILKDHAFADSAKNASVVLWTLRRFLDILKTRGGKSLALMGDVVTYFD